MILQTLIDSLIQLLIFSLIPFLWWFVTIRKKESFFKWLGLKTPVIDDKKKMVYIFLVTMILLVAPGMFLLSSFSDKSILAGAKYANSGFIGFVSILIFAFIQTGLAEEIFFRGFLNKRLSNKFGFAVGNIAQATLFGLLHGVLLFLVVSPLTSIFVIIFTATAGWLMGYIDEKIAGGSIFPSILIHSLVNVISSFVFLTGIVKV